MCGLVEKRSPQAQHMAKRAQKDDPKPRKTQRHGEPDRWAQNDPHMGLSWPEVGGKLDQLGPSWPILAEFWPRVRHLSPNLALKCIF